MTGRELLVLYGLVGIACAIAVLRRRASALSALLTIPLWPLWAPFALAPSCEQVRAAHAVVPARVAAALAAAVAAVADSPMSSVFTPAAAARIGAGVARVARRLAELEALAPRPGFDSSASARRLSSLASDGASDRALATARLRHDSLVRLDALRAADARALEDLADLLEALCTQLVLARYEGSPADDASAIATEVWARLEGLGAAAEPGSPLLPDG